MKILLFLVLIIISANSIAQAPPGAVAERQRSGDHQMPSPPEAVRPEPIKAASASNEELTELLRAQTTAIKSILNKLNSLEERIDEIEKRRP